MMFAASMGAFAQTPAAQGDEKTLKPVIVKADAEREQEGKNTLRTTTTRIGHTPPKRNQPPTFSPPKSYKDE